MDEISNALISPQGVEDQECVFYGKATRDRLRLEIARANRQYTEVAKYFFGRNVFDSFDARSLLAKAHGDIQNGKRMETQLQMPFELSRIIGASLSKADTFRTC